MTAIATFSLIAVAISVAAILFWPRNEEGTVLRSGLLMATAVALFLWSVVPATYVDRRQDEAERVVLATQAEALTSKSADLMDAQVALADEKAKLSEAENKIGKLEIELELLKKTTSSEREKAAAASAELEQRLRAALGVVADVDKVTQAVTFSETALFARGQAELSCESRENLSRLVPWLAVRLSRTPDIKLQIQGHTDTDGPLPVNQRLAAARANAVMQYLVRAGVTSSNLVTEPLWWQRPMSQDRLLSFEEALKFNKTEQQKERNRRVEIVPVPSTVSK